MGRNKAYTKPTRVYYIRLNMDDPCISFLEQRGHNGDCKSDIISKALRSYLDPEPYAKLARVRTQKNWLIHEIEVLNATLRKLNELELELQKDTKVR